MTHPSDLFDYEEGFIDTPKGLHMLAGLTGFTDAGGTLNQVADQIFANLEHELIVQFRNDELLDYRSRRPIMFFERDHIDAYEPAVLGIYLVHDEANQPFLYLHGYEPDFRWEAFTDAITELVEELEVEDFTWVHSIPFPLPHTRPVGVTVSGNRTDIIDAVSEWKPQTQVPGNVLHLIEFKLSAIDLPIVGYVMLVPHYLSDSEYPQSAVKAFEQITASTGLVFPTDALRDEGREFLQKLEDQVAKSEELSKLVANLEQGYSNEMTGPIRAPISRPATHIPSAEEIAAELEGYLATRRRNAADEE